MTEVLPNTSGRELPARVGRYRVLCELGQGSMAALYLGRAGGLGGFERLFALKVVHAHLCRKPAFIEMFLNEARIAASVHHPNIVPVYEVDVDDGRYFLAMDYVSGETLSLLLRSTWNNGRELPARLAAHIVASAAEGLHAAHELVDADGEPRSVVHRDVAPQNIMIGYDGIVRVTDFGIARAMDTLSQTRPGVLMGTVSYMAPEQVRHGPLDRRVDVFALGVVLWESTLGLRLFKDVTDAKTARRVLKLEIPPPSAVRPGYPAELEAIVMKALQRDPAERFSTARALAEALFEYLATVERVSTPEMEGFVRDVFAERLEHRRALERDAREPEPSTMLGDYLSDSSQTLGLERLTQSERWQVESDDIEPLDIARDTLADSSPPDFEAPKDTLVATPAELVFGGAVPVVDQRAVATELIRDTARIPVAVVDAVQTVEPTKRLPNPLGSAGGSEALADDSVDEVFSGGDSGGGAFDDDDIAPLLAEERRSRRTRAAIGIGIVGAFVVAAIALRSADDTEVAGLALRDDVAATARGADAELAPAIETARGAEVAPGDDAELAPAIETARGAEVAPRDDAEIAPAIEVARGAEVAPGAAIPSGVEPIPTARTPVAPPADDAPTRVTVQVEVTPKHATVLLDGRPHRGPIELARSDATEHVVRAHAPGYGSRTIVVDGTADRTLAIVLEKLPSEAPPPPKKRKRRRARRKTKVEADQPLLFDGDDL